MGTGFTTHCKPGFRILDDPQIGRIHQAVLKILDEVGVRVNHPEALDLLAGHGARVIDDNLVRIPAFLVEDAIASTPPNLVIFNRNKNKVMELGGRRSYFGTGTDLPKTVDLETREIRDTRADDIITSTIISDALPNIDFIGFNRKNLPNWIKDGQKKIDDKLLEKARGILDTHQPAPLAADIKTELDRIWEDVSTARKYRK